MGLALDTNRSGAAPGVFELGLPIAWEDSHVNCFLLPDREHVDMIDCGMSAEESFALIRAAVRELAGPQGRVRRLLVTHIHPDHYGAAGGLTQRGGAPTHLHRPAVPMGNRTYHLD